MIHTIIKYLLISITLFFCSCHKPKTDIITPAKQLIERQIGERAQSIHFEYIEPSDGKDIFEVIASDGRLTLRGSRLRCYLLRFSYVHERGLQEYENMER